jgi:hypothetical protein
LPDFVATAVKQIHDRLRALKDEAMRLEAARLPDRRKAPARTARERRHSAHAAPLHRSAQRALTGAPGSPSP